MAKELNFNILDEEQEPRKAGGIYAKGRTRRWLSRDASPVVQMSIRMPTETYERFRDLCEQERRTNGDMVQILMESYQSKETSGGGKVE